MHNWHEAIGIALVAAPLVVVVVALGLINPMAIVVIIGFLLGVIFLIAAIAILIKLFWYIKDKVGG